MKNKLLINVALMSSILLTGCQSSISKEKFLKVYDKAKVNCALDSSEYDNILIHNQLSTSKYNYKAGEFYSYNTFALILIIPYIEGKYTWKEGDKYYHATTHTDSKKDTYVEINEEQFNAYMEAGRLEIYNMLNKFFTIGDYLLDDEHEEGSSPYEYKSVSNKYTYNVFKKYTAVRSKATKTTTEYVDGSEVEKEMTDEYLLEFANDMPHYYYSKINDSETKWTYEYGKAKLNKPSKATTSESE